MGTDGGVSGRCNQNLGLTGGKPSVITDGGSRLPTEPGSPRPLGNAVKALKRLVAALRDVFDLSAA